MVFVIPYPFLSILLTPFHIGTEKFLSFSVISPKQVNCSSTSSVTTCMMKMIITAYSIVKNYGNFFRKTIF